MYPEVELVSFIINNLTGEPTCYEIDRTIDERGVLLTVSIDREHAGRVIGKKGTAAEAIRSLLRTLGVRNNARYSMKITERGE